MKKLKPRKNKRHKKFGMSGSTAPLFIRKRMSYSHKKRYKNPAERQKQSDGLHKRYSDVCERQKSSEIMSKRWSNPKEREKLLNRPKRIGFHHTSETKEKNRIAQIERMKDKRRREHLRQLNLGKKYSKETCQKKSLSLLITYKNPEICEKLKRAQKKRWSDPKEHIRMSEIQQESIRLNPDIVKRRTAGVILNYKTNPLTREKQSKAVAGSKSYLWRGGNKDGYPEGWTPHFRKTIRERDKHLCRICGKTKEENKQELSVHHIDYVKKNLSYLNLVSTCRSCNSRFNQNEKYWTRILTKFMHQKKYKFVFQMLSHSKSKLPLCALRLIADAKKIISARKNKSDCSPTHKR